MPLLFSAVFSRALDYDTAFNNLSNPRVFTDFQLFALRWLICFCIALSFDQRSLAFYTEFFVAVNKFKNIFCLLTSSRIRRPFPLRCTCKVFFSTGARDYSTLFFALANFFANG
jgi:hypothetical protein